MANITAAAVNELRKRTGVGMMDCKKALVECDGDMDKAIDYLREKGQKLAAKRADRDASEGAVLATVNADKTFAAVIMMNCETDFVAKNEDFVAFTREVLQKAVDAKAKSLEEVMALTINGLSVETMIVEQVAKIGEKITLSHYYPIEAVATYAYVHPGNRMASVVGLSKAGYDVVLLDFPADEHMTVGIRTNDDSAYVDGYAVIETTNDVSFVSETDLKTEANIIPIGDGKITYTAGGEVQQILEY